MRSSGHLERQREEIQKDISGFLRYGRNDLACIVAEWLIQGQLLKLLTFFSEMVEELSKR
jgi:hypothetical protein